MLGGTVPRELRPWLYAIVRNCCLSAIAARRHAVELDEHTASLAGLSEVVHERHLSLCVGCRDFQKALAAQRRSLAVALPVLPSAGLAAKILSHGALQAAGAAGQAGGAVGAAAAPSGAVAGGGASVTTAASTVATGASAAAGGGGTSAVVGGGVLAKVAVGGAVAALATAGALTTVRHLAHPSRRYVAHAHVDRAHRSHRARVPTRSCSARRLHGC
jgi:hypothetical protein